MKYPIPFYKYDLPKLTTDQMIEVDRLMIEEYKIELIQMMENAGRCLAILALNQFLESASGSVTVLAGSGGNGGGAMVCARRLASWGSKVDVFVTNQERMKDVPRHQLDILVQMGVPVHSVEELQGTESTDLIIDGIIGYSLQGNPKGEAKSMIEWANSHGAPKLSLDSPSGVDLTSGNIYDPAIHAQATMTLALPKTGLYEQEVKTIRGELYLADISVPPSLYSKPQLGIEVGPIFKSSDVLRID